MTRDPQEGYALGEKAIASIKGRLEPKRIEEMERLIGIGKVARYALAYEALLKQYEGAQSRLKRIIDAKTDEERAASLQALADYWYMHNQRPANLDYGLSFDQLYQIELMCDLAAAKEVH